MLGRAGRTVLVLLATMLVAGVPTSAAAGDDGLIPDVQRQAADLNAQLSQRIAAGLDPVRADQFMWRLSLVMSQQPGSWWEAPIVGWQKRTRLQALDAELRQQYAASVDEHRSAFLRALRHWSELEEEADHGGVSTADLEGTRARFLGYAQQATSPNGFTSLGQVLANEAGALRDRLAGYRLARTQVLHTLESTRTLLARTQQYPELNLTAFGATVAQAPGEIGAVHTPEGFAPIQARLEQAALGLQGMLDARTSAYAQLEEARSALDSARASGVDATPESGVISALAQRLLTAPDQATLQNIAAQLAGQRQALADAVLLKQLSSYNPGSLPAGKIIVISLSRQVLTAYQDGNLVLSNFVTTGRPDLPTPLGVSQIMAKYSPFLFVSPWAYGSPYWYAPSWTTYAMLFRSGGYFIHDAPWRSVYGPSVNRWDGSHGCVNVPFASMASLWSWTPIGTTVVVQP